MVLIRIVVDYLDVLVSDDPTPESRLSLRSVLSACSSESSGDSSSPGRSCSLDRDDDT